MEPQNWKRRIEEAKDKGLQRSIEEAQLSSLNESIPDQARTLLFLAALHDLNPDDPLSVFARFLSFLRDGDPRTLFLLAVKASDAKHFAYVIVLCDYYLSHFDESSHEVRLIKAHAEISLGLNQDARVSLQSVPEETSLWLGDRLVIAKSLLE